MKNQKLPVDDFRVQIINSVRSSSVTIITAETGAGKSTRVPQFLLDEGYSLVVTQPRRLAARSVAKRVAQERNGELGQEIGFRTAYERQDSASTRCLFCTDGLALVRELMGVGRHHILVLDEVHEWNLNMEVLAAWSKRQIENGAAFKLVIMSATLEAEKLSEFFSSAPVISVPGRCYPVEERQADHSERMQSLNVLQDVTTLLQEGRNVLVFKPGKAEILELTAALKKVEGLQAEILPLHGELESEDQDKVFRTYDRAKCVIATNVAQTSITIEDIDAVVDDGTEKRIELMDGVEGLYLRAISMADRAQRKGRAGRCREGIYIDHCPQGEGRLDFPLAEILRVRLDQTVLRLAEAKIDAEELSFFHQPPLDQIHEAKRALRALGCMDENGEVTSTGRQVARLPISVQYGRMIVEADKLGVVGDIISVAAILEQGGITSRKVKMPDGSEEDGNDLARRKFCPEEKDSNVLAQLAIFRGAKNLSNEDRRLNGLFVKAYHQANDRRRLLTDSLKGKVHSLQSSGKRDDIMRAICSGMIDHLYKSVSWGEWKNGDDTIRKQAREELQFGGDWLIGLPFDIEIQTRRGRMILHLVTMATSVNPTMLVEVAPQLSKVVEGVNPQYNSEKDACVSTRQTYFNGILVKEEVVETPDHSQAAEVFAQWLANKLYYGYSLAGYDFVAQNVATAKRMRELNQRSGEKIFLCPNSNWEWQEFCREKLNGTARLADAQTESLLLPVIDAAKEAKILAENPDSIIVNGEEIHVSYSENQASIQITEQMAKESEGAVTLPGGRSVSLSVDWNNSFCDWVEVKAYFENKRLTEAWSQAERSFNSSWLEGQENLKNLLVQLKPIEVAVKDDGSSLCAYPSLCVSGDQVRLVLKKNQEEAEVETLKAVRSFIGYYSGSSLGQVHPWYRYWSWTALGKLAQRQISEAVDSAIANLSVENISDTIAAVEEKIALVKSELEQKNTETIELVAKFQESFQNYLNEIPADLVIDEVNQIRDLISSASSAAGQADFPGAEESISEAKDLMEKLAGLAEERSRS